MFDWPLELDLSNVEEVTELIAYMIVLVIIFVLYFCMTPCREDSIYVNETNVFCEEGNTTDTKMNMIMKNTEVFKFEDEGQRNKCHLYESNTSCSQNVISI